MTCRSFRQLFDGYLDGELSESQTAELHAHLLQCPLCQREVELMRAGGDVIALDTRGPRLSDDFTDRVMAELPARLAPAPVQGRTFFRMRRVAEFGALAAAAVVALAVVWNPRPTANPVAPALVQAPAETASTGTRVAGETATITDVLGGPEVDGVMHIGRDSYAQWGQVAERVSDAWSHNLRDIESQLAAPVTDRAAEPAEDSASFVNELLRPFFTLINPPVPASPVEDVERF